MEQDRERGAPSGGRGGRIAAKIAYWLAVFVISLALLIGLILLLESRDESSIDGGSAGPPAITVSAASQS